MLIKLMITFFLIFNIKIEQIINDLKLSKLYEYQIKRPLMILEKLIIFIPILLFCLPVHAQKDTQYKVYFYFEDAVGNHDTVLVAYDDLVPIDLNGKLIDTLFGETLDTFAFDSIFEVKVAPFLDGPRNYQYKNYRLFEPLILPTHYVDGCLFPEGVNFFVQTKNFPITVTWDFQFTSPCIDGTFLTPDFLYHQLNPVYWMQEEWARFCCLESSLEYKIDLTKGYRHPDSLGERTIFIERPIVGSLNEKDTIWGLNLVYMPANMYSPCSLTRNNETKNQSDVRVYPVPSYNYIYFDNEGNLSKFDLIIFNDNGIELQKLTLQENDSVKLDIGSYYSGLYFYILITNDLRVQSGKFQKI